MYGRLWSIRLRTTWLFCLAIVSGAAAQPAGASYELFTTRNGLPHNVVLSIFQDSKGYIWVGTLNGLCKYDGNGFTQPVLPSGAIIHAITESRDGHIWIATRTHGAIVYNRNTGAWVSPGKQIGRQSINAIWEDTNGDTWVGGIGPEFFRLRKQQPEKWQIQMAAYNRKGVDQIFRNRKGNLCIAGEGRVCLLQDSLTRPEGSEKGLLEGVRVCPDKRGDFYVVSARGPGFYNTITGQLTLFSDKYFSDPVSAVMHVNSKGNLLVADHQVVKCFSKSGDVIYSSAIASLRQLYKQTQVHAVYEDNSGVIWLGTSNGLVKLIRPGPAFGMLGTDTSARALSASYVRSLMLDKQNQLWVGYKQGPIDCIRNIQASSGGTHNYLPNIPGGQLTINAFLQTRSGQIICGGLEGIYEVKGTRLQPLQSGGSQHKITEVWSLMEDSTGNIWAGTNGNGLYIIHPGGSQVEHFLADSARRLSVWCMVRDSRNHLLLGTGNGVLEVSSKSTGPLQFIPRNRAADGTTITGTDVWSISETRDGMYLIGTTDAGLNTADTGWQHFRFYDGSNKGISGIIPGREDTYWLMSMNGIQLFDRRNHTFRTYNEDDGLLSSDFNFKALAGPLNGNYYMGTKLGIVVFSPHKITHRVVSWRQVHITAFRVFDKVLYSEPMPGSVITLTHDANFFSLHLAMLDYRNVARHKFRYRLEGFDRDWRYTGHQDATAQYTNVPGGTYTFRVQGVVDGSGWVGKETTLQIVVKPAYWQTLTFRVAMLVLVCGLIALAVVLRFRLLVHREKEKNTISKRMAELELRALQAQMNPHFIFNAVNAVQDFVLKRDERAANDYLSRFGLLMRLYLESSKKKFIMLDEELELIRLYVSLELMRFGDRFTFQLEVDPGLQTESIEIPSMLLQPFIENAINHGLMNKEGKGQLTVSFRFDGNDVLCCTVEDDGVGRAEAAELRRQSLHPHRSRGMELVRERLHTFGQLEGTKVTIAITDKTGPGGEATGTRVEIRIHLT